MAGGVSDERAADREEQPSYRERSTKARGKTKEDGIRQSQKLLLTWLIEDTKLFGRIENYISPDDFTEEIYRKVAEILFAQYKETGTVNPARIISMFPDEEEQREIAGLFNATIHPVESEEEREKALKETVIRVKDHSIRHRTQELAPTDMESLMKLIEDKKALEKLTRI
jgi:DNA primase